MSIKIESLKSFNKRLIEFLECAQTMFPEQTTEISFALNSFSLIMKGKVNLIATYWNTFVLQQHSESIQNGDLEHFLLFDYSTYGVPVEFLTMIETIRAPMIKELLVNNNMEFKSTIVEYLQDLNVLCFRYFNTNTASFHK